MKLLTFVYIVPFLVLALTSCRGGHLMKGNDKLFVFNKVSAPDLPDATVEMAEDDAGRIYLEVRAQKQNVLYAGDSGKFIKASSADWDMDGINVRGTGRKVGQLAPSSEYPLGMEATTRDQHGNLWELERSNNKEQAELILKGTAAELKPGMSKTIAEGNWQHLVTDEYGFVWTGGAGELFQLDPRNPEATLSKDIAVTALAVSPDGHVMFGTPEGRLYEVDFVKNGESQIHRLDSGKLPKSPIQGALCASDGSIWVVADGNVYHAKAAENGWQRDWQELARMPWGNHDISTATVDDQLYIAGGLGPRGFPTGYSPFDEVLTYRPGKDTWEIVARLDQPICYSGVASLDEEIWIVGGYFESEDGKKTTDKVDIFDPQTGNVRSGPLLDRPRAQPVVVHSDQRIYVIGGDSEGEVDNSMVSIGVGEKTWRKEPDAPQPVKQATGCFLNDNIYVFPGHEKAYKYDITDQEWEMVDPPPAIEKFPIAGLCGVHKEEVWLMGGKQTEKRRATWIYSPETEEWRSGPDLPTHRNWGAAVDINGRLIIIGGAYHKPVAELPYIFSDRAFMLRD